jgi:hypothetical protein
MSQNTEKAQLEPTFQHDSLFLDVCFLISGLSDESKRVLIKGLGLQDELDVSES